MTILLADVPVAALSIDVTRFPDRDESYILEHLMYYCSKFDPLPAVTVSLSGGTATVVRGHKYLTIARALGRPSIRAVLPDPSEAGVTEFLARPDVKVLDWKAIQEKEDQEPNPKGWHVFFFARPLSPSERLEFERRVAALFPSERVQIVYDDARALAEFEARTPVTDHAWAARHLDLFSSFSRDCVPIVSFQGARFPSEK